MWAVGWGYYVTYVQAHMRIFQYWVILSVLPLYFPVCVANY